MEGKNKGRKTKEGKMARKQERNKEKRGKCQRTKKGERRQKLKMGYGRKLLGLSNHYASKSEYSED